MFSDKFGWHPISTAPINTDVMLMVTDGGEPYAVFKPFKLTRGRLGQLRALAVTPLQWKRYVARPTKR